MTYLEMLEELLRSRCLRALSDMALERTKARCLELDATNPKNKLPARITAAKGSRLEAPVSARKPLPQAKTLLDLLRAFKQGYAEARKANKKDKRFVEQNKAMGYRTDSRDLLILRMMAKKHSHHLVESGIPGFLLFSLQKGRPVTVKRFEMWSRTKWKNRRK